MKYILSTLAAVALVGPALAGPALAAGQAEPEKSAPTVEEVTDTSQNRMVCKRQKDTGSRLGSKRICMTAAQWAQKKRDERAVTERTQAARWKSD